MSPEEFGRMVPRIRSRLPGSASRNLAERLRRVESRNVTRLTDEFPVFWNEARGANVRDADGNVLLDLTGAFGVSILGHGDPRITRIVSDQMKRLIHGMGDVHPPSIKVELLEHLAGLLPWDSPRTVLATSGSEAVEVALKTALLSTGKPGILSFEGGYHGLTLGALAATARRDFQKPFSARLYKGSLAFPFPRAGEAEEVLFRVERAFRRGAPNGDPIGAVVVEPVQGRGGVRIPPDGFLAQLGALAREAGVLVVADEVFTGLGRCGSFLASVASGLEPDLVCLGKALGGGFPVSACAGDRTVMDAWPPSEGEALHTSTFLGHPAGASAALALLRILEEDDVPRRAEALGSRFLDALEDALRDVDGVVDIRGEGLMIGIELGPGEGVEVTHQALGHGAIVLPAGGEGEVVQLTPPVTITDEQLDASVEILARAVRGALRSRGGRGAATGAVGEPVSRTPEDGAS